MISYDRTITLPIAPSLPLSVVPAHFKVNSDRSDMNHSFAVYFVTIFCDLVNSANTLQSAKGKFLLNVVIFSSYSPSRRSVWENLDQGRKYRPNAVRCVHTTAVKILSYRPPARLIRCLLYGENKNNSIRLM